MRVGHNEPVQIKQLRILATVLLGFAVGQAGLGSGYLDGESGALLIAHATNAFAVLVLTALSAIFGFNYRRSGGPGWAFFLPLAMLGMAGIQITLGSAGIRGFHLVFNVPGDRVGDVTASYRAALEAQAGGSRVDVSAVRAVVGEFTRGHFARAV